MERLWRAIVEPRRWERSAQGLLGWGRRDLSVPRLGGQVRIGGLIVYGLLLILLFVAHRRDLPERGVPTVRVIPAFDE